MMLRIPPVAVVLALAVATTAGAWSSGGPAPDKILQGAGTGLNNIQGIAVDGSGTTFAVNYNASPQSLTAYSGDWANGNTAPSKTLVGAATGLHDPYDVAVDSSGRMYVANLNGDLTVHAANWAAGNTAPIRTITEYGTNTQLVDALALTVKDDGTIYVVQNRTNFFTFSYVGDVLVYGPTANGDVAPIQVISGGANAGNTGLTYASGIAVDGDGLIYVAAGSSGVRVFAANASGNATPIKTLTGNAYRVSFDTSGRLYVTDDSGGAIRVYEKGFASGAAPIKTLSGGSTGFGEPRDVAFDSAGRMYVGTSGNSSPTSVRVFSTSYQSITFPTLADTPLSTGTVTASASSSSSGTVTFTSTTPGICTSGGTDGATITLVGAGTCTVRAAQAGSATWNPAPPVDRSFVVTDVSPTPPTPSPAPSVEAAPGAPSTAATTAVIDTPASLTTTVLPSRTRLAAGQLMRLGIRTANAGGTATAPVTACLRVPANLIVVRSAPGTRSGRNVCFQMGAVLPGTQATRVVTVRSGVDGPTTDRISGTSQASGSASVAATPVVIAIAPRSGWTIVTG